MSQVGSKPTSVSANQSQPNFVAFELDLGAIRGRSPCSGPGREANTDRGGGGIDAAGAFEWDPTLRLALRNFRGGATVFWRSENVTR